MNRVVLAGVLCACGPSGKASEPSLEVVAEIPAVENRNLDLLFIIDDGAAAHLQFILAKALPTLFERLPALPDLHAGVVTMDLGTASTQGDPAPSIGIVGQGGCAGQGKGGNLTVGQATSVSDQFLSDIALADGTRGRNYEGELTVELGKMVSVGATGCGFEQPLGAMRAALDDNPNNVGFLRPDATLAVIFLGDEDDCSVRDPRLFTTPDTSSNPLQQFRCTRFGIRCLDGGNTIDDMAEVGVKDRCGPNTTESSLLEDPAVFRDFLFALKGEPRRVVVGGLFGQTTPFAVESRTINGVQQPALAHSCQFAGPDDIDNTADDHVADPGVRLDAFAHLFGDRGVTGSVCQNDLSAPLESIADRVAFAMGSPCITRPLFDADQDSDGLQPECVVEDLVGDTVTAIPPCPSSPTCWAIVTDASACPVLDHLQLVITREEAPTPATVTRARCSIDD